MDPYPDIQPIRIRTQYKSSIRFRKKTRIRNTAYDKITELGTLHILSTPHCVMFLYRRVTAMFFKTIFIFYCGIALSRHESLFSKSLRIMVDHLA